MRMFYIMILSLFASVSYSQESFSVSVNRDTVYLGNTIKLTYELKNIEGDFKAPPLDHLDVLSGPNTSMSVSIVNGVSSKTSSYTYLLRPDAVGSVVLEEAKVISLDSTYTSSSIMFEVVDNPDGIIQEEDDTQVGFGNFFNFDPWGRNQLPPQKKTTSPKRKMKRI